MTADAVSKRWLTAVVSILIEVSVMIKMWESPRHCFSFIGRSRVAAQKDHGQPVPNKTSRQHPRRDEGPQSSKESLKVFSRPSFQGTSSMIVGTWFAFIQLKPSMGFNRAVE